MSRWLLVVPLCTFGLLRPALAEYELGFSGPSALEVDGDGRVGTFFCTMTHSGGGKGAQGWSIGVMAEGGIISAITVDGTTAKSLMDGGFEDSQLTTGAGNEGAVSAVVLAFFSPVTLPLDAESTIAKITVRTKPGEPLPEKVTLKYVDGLVGKGQPVINIVTEDGFSGVVTVSTLDVEVPQATLVDPGCPIALVDQVLGSILPGGDTDVYSFTALAGTLLDVKLKVTTESPNLVLELFDPADQAVDVSAFLKAKKKNYQLKKVPLGQTGGYKLSVSDPDGIAGAYKLQLKGKLPKELTKGKGEIVTEAVGQVIEIPFTGLAGALFSASLSGKKGPILDVLELLDPNAAAVPFGDTLTEKGKSAKIKKLALPLTGNYVLRVQVNEVAGSVKHSWSQKAPKKQTLEECPES